MSFTGVRPRARIAGVAGVAILAAALVSGCGTNRHVSGRGVFAADCAVCHSISGSSAPTQQGGDLRRLYLPRDELVQYTAEMPVVNQPLTHERVEAVVDYIRSVQRAR